MTVFRGQLGDPNTLLYKGASRLASPLPLPDALLRHGDGNTLACVQAGEPRPKSGVTVITEGGKHSITAALK